MVLGDDKSFFIQVDRGVRLTTLFVLVIIALGYVFQLVRRSFSDGYMGAWEVLLNALPVMIVIAVNQSVDMHANGTLFDNFAVVFDYTKTLVNSSAKNLMISFNAAFMRNRG